MLSYHSTDAEKWKSMFVGLTDDDYNRASQAWARLVYYGISVTGAIVGMPKVLGYDDIEKTLMFMNEFAPDTIQLWEPGYSRYTAPEMIERMKIDEEEFIRFAYRMYKACDKTVVLWNKDPNLPLQFDPYDLMIQSVQQGKENVVWLTGSCAYQRLKGKILNLSHYFPNSHSVKLVTNYTYAGNINCNGLLMISDLQAAVNELNSPDLVVVPDVMLDKLGNDLMGVNYQTLGHSNNPIFWWRH
jgi:hypothetical protein